MIVLVCPSLSPWGFPHLFVNVYHFPGEAIGLLHLFRAVCPRVACLRKGLTVLLELAEPSVDPSLLQLRRAAQRLLAREESSAGKQRMPQAKVQKFLRSGSVMPNPNGLVCTGNMVVL